MFGYGRVHILKYLLSIGKKIMTYQTINNNISTTNRKLNYVDGQMLKVQETKIPHGGYNKFSGLFRGS